MSVFAFWAIFDANKCSTKSFAIPRCIPDWHKLHMISACVCGNFDPSHNITQGYIIVALVKCRKMI